MIGSSGFIGVMVVVFLSDCEEKFTDSEAESLVTSMMVTMTTTPSKNPATQPITTFTHIRGFLGGRSLKTLTYTFY